jgi:diguanylate cyclase (GGDEF)-like protein/PAS domain S-box-containing protein
MGSTAREREAPPPEVGIYRQIARMFAPPALLVNDQDELIFTSNGAARYTLLREGRFTIDVYDLVLPDLRASLRAVLFRARRTGRAIRVPITLESDGNAKHNVIIEATPFDYSQPNWILVTLIETADANPVEDGAEGADGPVIQVLEMELAATRDNLQTLVEELETINEELQTTNEELQSTTEEAQVTNEQLQTSNEELQSSNEELRTLNDELQAKNNELERLYTELVALDGSLRVPFLVLDSELRIRRIGRHAGLVLAAEGVRVGDLLGAVEWLGPPPDEIALFRVGAVTTGTSIWTCGGRTWRVEVSEYALGIGLAPGYLISFHELTQVILERNRAEHTERTLAKTIASIHEAVIRVDARGLVEFVNDAAALLLEADREQLKGQAYARALRLQGSATADEPVPDYVRMVLETGQPVRSEHLVWLETGQRRRMVEVAVTPVEGDDHSQVEGVVVIVRDVTEREDLLSELSWRGSHDKLTGLENRIAFDQALEEVRQRAILTGQAAWLLLMDLDRFKPVNDVAGHAVGDAVLREISNVMRGAIRTSDRLFRVGGDEFALLLEGIGLPVVEKIARKMVGEVRRYRPNAPADSFRLGVSIGITAIHVGVGRTEADLIRDADLALYRVKASGGGGFRIAQPREVEGAPTPTESVYQRLCEALEGHRLILMAQPIVPLRGGPTMFEILTRLPGPDGTLISPNEFIPMAERYALMPEVDEQVIAETLRYLAERERTGVPLPVLCLNLSGRSVANPLFMARLKPLLDQYESLIPQLVFEVTETAAIFDLAQASATLSQLRQRGAFTALDDFGAGNATFDALKSLDVQFVKLDRKFVAGMRDEPFNRACVEAMCRVAQALKKRIVAEGIERELLVSDLAALGVEYGQGWYFGRPVRLDELAPAETYPHGPLRSL